MPNEKYSDRANPTSSPVVIVGAGLAGLFTALKLSPTPVTVLSPFPLGDGASSAWAQGGMAAAVGEGDTPEAHTDDTLVAGAGLVDSKIALGVAQEAPDRVRDLLAYGVPFDTDLEGRLQLSREAAHSARRIVRVAGDRAGAATMAALIAAVRQADHITVLEGVSATDLRVVDGKVAGVFVSPSSTSDETSDAEPMAASPRLIRARAVVLATGGIGQLYAVTTNPAGSTGRGLAMAARHGARIADPEFMQFHPTAIKSSLDPAPLATEALRGDGAHLVNGRGERFMKGVHVDAELAPRDVVARAVHREVTSGRGAYLDCRKAVGSALPERFPTVYAKCREADIDPVREAIPIAPAAHYHMGGVWTDADGRTSLPGLWACGEVAATGLHGANRLASNSLIEAVVFGARIAAALKAEPIVEASRRGVTLIDQSRTGGPSRASAAANSAQTRGARALSTARLARLRMRLRETMASHVGVARDPMGLREALGVAREIEREAAAASATPDAAALADEARVVLLVAAAAWSRNESRGAHFRTDQTQPAAEIGERTIISLSDAEIIADAVGLVDADVWTAKMTTAVDA